MSLSEELKSFEGRAAAPAAPGQDAVNVPMIRHWAEAMGDTNPVYLDEEAARATGRSGVIAPPAMLQAWTMRGYAASQAPSPTDTALGELIALLDEHGFTSVVATDCEQEYLRELHPGDHLSVAEVIDSVSDEKRTALGVGHFLTTVRTYRDQHGDVVATQRWRTLRFRPGTGRVAAPDETPATATASPQVTADGGSEAARPLRPRPALNRDNAFWFEAAREHRLAIQRCASCGTLRHPPGPCCPQCRSFEWDTVQASGRGTVHSFVVNHHPQVPAFDYPLVVVLVELEEGVRLVANVVDVQPGDVAIGMPVVLDWIDPDPDLALPAFRPAGAEHSRSETA
jgi:uncharacterized OB-fold protein/acyl dehydratase